MTSPVEAILIGAGNRGAEVYGAWALRHPDRLRMTAIAEPLAVRRERTAAQHGIPAERQFEGWEDLLARPQMAQAAIITTQDQMHTQPTLAALAAGYDVLLEKPMAHRLDECVALVQAAERAGRMLQIAHVMRYTRAFSLIHEIVQSGRLGQVITMSHRENVSSWHMAHSFVRGNWRSADQSSPMILAKSCHDLDVLYWIVGRRAVRLSSTGSLLHFRRENMPAGAPERCLEGCPAQDTCPFYAPALYLNLEPFMHSLAQARGSAYRLAARAAIYTPRLFRAAGRVLPPLRALSEYSGWPRSVISDHPADMESLRQALLTGPYGRCVYRCDNDVVDHQIVMIEFEGGLSASFTMHGHSFEEGRTTRIDGSQATLLAKFSHNRTFVEVRDHRSFRAEQVLMPNMVETDGHGGGDNGLMHAFVTAMQGGQRDPLTSARASLESHLMAFAAEEARLAGSVVDMAEFRARAEVAGTAAG
jgi:predicted dehydrogenase